MKIGLKSKLFAEKRLFVAVIILTITAFTLRISLPTARAAVGFFDAINNTFDLKANASAPEYELLNSQQIGLAADHYLGSNPSLSETFGTGGAVTLVEDNALIPQSGPGGTVADIVDLPKSDHISLYVVHDGDSLSEIAEMFNVSINTILWANDLPRGAAIHEGQMLTILPITGIQHKVLKGETIQSIAKKYSGDVKEIIQYNGLEVGGVLKDGQLILIPDGEEVLVAATSGNKPTSRVTGAGGPSYAGYYLRPLVGGVKTQGLHGYNAIDIGTSVGTPILASAAGTIIVSREGGWNGGYGTYIVITHANGTQTLYAHLSSSLMAVGQKVAQAQVIGYSGNTGRSTGPHLHFEVRGAKNPF